MRTTTRPPPSLPNAAPSTRAPRSRPANASVASLVTRKRDCALSFLLVCVATLVAVGGAERSARKKKQAARAVAQARTSGSDRNKVIAGIAVVAVLALAVIGYVVFQQMKPPKSATDAIPQTSADHIISAPAVRDGSTVLVGKDTATVTIDVYEDFLCPICGTFEKTYGADIKKAVEDGKVKVRYHILPLLNRLTTLSDVARLRILRLLDREELSVGELGKALQLPQSTVSRHLKLLHEGGWTSKRAEGTASLYRVAEQSLPPEMRELWKLARTQLGDTSSGVVPTPPLSGSRRRF